MSDTKETITKRPRGVGRKIFCSAMLVAAVLLVSGFVVGNSQYRARWDHAQLREGVHWVLSGLDATDTQRTKINAILDDLAPNMVELQGESQALRARFSKALEADQINPNELAAIKATSISLAERALSQGIDATVSISAVLTPEQRRKLSEAWRKH